MLTVFEECSSFASTNQEGKPAFIRFQVTAVDMNALLKIEIFVPSSLVGKSTHLPDFALKYTLSLDIKKVACNLQRSHLL